MRPVAQPPLVEFHTADGLYIRQIVLPQAGLLVPSHAHAWSHSTAVATGEVMAWKDGAFLGRFVAPAVMFIEAGAKHSFLTIRPTILYCLHNLHGAEAVRILAEHEFTPQEAASLMREVVV